MPRLLIALTVLLAACGRSAFEPTPTGVPPVSPALTTAAASEPYTRLREKMVTAQIQARDVRDRDVLDAMKVVPRHLFVPADLVDQAYEDHPLPIGYGQTI